MSLDSLQELIDSAADLPRIPQEAVERYCQSMSAMIESVDWQVKGDAALGTLLGGGTVAMMEDNHRNHAAFMKTVLKLHLPELLARVVPWVFRTYHKHGFSYGYFPAEVAAWKQACREHLPDDACGAILPWYDWLAEQSGRAETVAALAGHIETASIDEYGEVRERFLADLIAGDYSACLACAQQHTATSDAQSRFYVSVLQPAMYRIGQLWETGEISVAQEHLCASMVGRLMAVIYEPRRATARNQATAVVTCAWNEYHELGAWMLADMLAMDGWTVRYLGANTPNKDLLDLLADVQPQLLAISVSMPYNLDRVEELIRDIRANRSLGATRIFVGGQAFAWMPDLWKRIGADAYAPDALDAVEAARKMQTGGPRQ